MPVQFGTMAFSLICRCRCRRRRHSNSSSSHAPRQSCRRPSTAAGCCSPVSAVHLVQLSVHAAKLLEQQAWTGVLPAACITHKEIETTTFPCAGLHLESPVVMADAGSIQPPHGGAVLVLLCCVALGRMV